MFILNEEQNIHVNPYDTARIKEYAKSYGIDITGVKFKRNKGLTWRKYVACFSVLHPNTIYFCHDANVGKCFPNIAHELYHRMQYKTLGALLYCFLAFPLWRRWTLETEA